MKFYQRLAYYLFGVLLGSILLVTIFNKRDQDFSYMPNARTLKNINGKPLVYSHQARQQVDAGEIDTASVNKTLKFGTVDFDKSKKEIGVTYATADTSVGQLPSWRVLPVAQPKAVKGKKEKRKPLPTNGKLYVIEGKNPKNVPIWVEIVNCDSLAIVRRILK